MSISTRFFAKWSALILTSWTCVLLGGESAESLYTPEKNGPTPQSADAQTNNDPAQRVSISLNAQQQPPTPSGQPEGPPPKQQDNKGVVPPSVPRQVPQPEQIDKQTSKWTDPVVLATLIVGGIYAAILVVYIFQLVEMRKSTNAATDTSRIARAALIATNRAWITVDIGIGEPLVFVENGGARTTITFKMRNVGNAPAVHITPHAWLVRSEGLVDPRMRLPREEQIRRCGEIKNQPFAEGFMLFPGESFPKSQGYGAYGIGVGIYREEIEKGLFSYDNRFANQPPPPGYDPNKKYAALVIIGCVDYGFVSDPDRHHQTGFAFYVRNTRGGPADLVSPDDGLIPIENIRLDPSPFGVGRYAD